MQSVEKLRETRFDSVHRRRNDGTHPEPPIAGPSAWLGSELARSDSWIFRFTDRDIEELLTAVHVLKARRIPLERADRSAFPLPSLGKKLDDIRRELLDGRGFIVLRGFPIAETSKKEAARAFWGISQYIGSPRPQNAEGHLIGHVTDLGADLDNPNARIYATNYAHRFHTDSVDIVGLLCLQPAKYGGSSSVVSSVTIYNEMCTSAPFLLKELFRPLPVTRKGEIPAGAKAYYCMPVFHWYHNRLSVIFSRDFIEGSQVFPEAPRVTQRQVQALDVFEGLAANPTLRLDMELEQGDMQFLHNHQILHARNAYWDYPEPERKRHLLRIWLCPPDGRPLPAVFAHRYGSVEIGNRGGIRLPNVSPSVPLDSVPEPWWLVERH